MPTMSRMRLLTLSSMSPYCPPRQPSSPDSALSEVALRCSGGGLVGLDDLCGRGDLNPHALRHQILNLTCLPFHHPRDLQYATESGKKKQRNVGTSRHAATSGDDCNTERVYLTKRSIGHRVAKVCRSCYGGLVRHDCEHRNAGHSGRKADSQKGRSSANLLFNHPSRGVT